jgi:alpha-tubulin suppressor-like RCC1 family protein
MTNKDLSMLQDMASVPFQVDFPIPVAKVTCGDGFSAILSVEGLVYTWGYNNYGALGIDKENVML